MREQYAALVRRAELHKSTGNGMLTAHFYRAPLRFAEQYRASFSNEEMDTLMREEQAAIHHAVDAGESKTTTVGTEIPREYIERIRATAEETMSALLAEVAYPIHRREHLEEVIDGIRADTPLHSLFGTTSFGEGKVVGESSGEVKNRELAMESHAILLARCAGQAIAVTLIIRALYY